MSLRRVCMSVPMAAVRRQRLLSPLTSLISTRSYAVAKSSSDAAGSIMGLGKGKKKLGKLGTVEKRVLPVETDPEKLVNYVCGSNIYTTGEDLKLKPDSEYPAWLWTLRLGPPPPLEELSPDTKEYWQRVRTAGMRRNNKLNSLRKFH